MTKTRWCLAAALAGAALLSAPARAADPKFEYKNGDDFKSQWKALVQAGFLMNTGNSNALSFSAGGMAAWSDGKNRLSLELGGAYAKATQITGDDINKSGTIDAGEIVRSDKTTTALWNAKLRYDRFLTTNNILYIAALAFGNEPAGKTVAGGGQVGYARQLYKSDMHLLMLELGYDFSYERLTTYSATVPDLYIHSLRGFFGYGLTLTKDTALMADVEVLCNVNPLQGGPAYGGTGDNIDPFQDTRVNGRVSLNTKLYKKISLRVGFTARYDNAPAPAATLGMPYGAGFYPLSEKLDTLTDVSLIVTFL